MFFEHNLFPIKFTPMKIYFVLCVVMFACFADTSFAQFGINNAQAKQKQLLQIPMVHIPQVSSLFVPVHIDTVKPFVTTLKPIVFVRQESAACNYFKQLKPTLVLNADRANQVTANLEWQTKYAFYATGFNIERSFGDTLHFFTVNYAAASQGTSFKKNYHLPDYNDYSGLTFYRVKQRNGDTGFLYSNIVSIKGNEAVPLSIYPVPATEKVRINIAPKQSGNAVIMVYDLTGKIIHQQNASCIANSFNESCLNVTKLAAGLYQVRVLMPDKTFLTGNFIKE